MTVRFKRSLFAVLAAVLTVLGLATVGLTATPQAAHAAACNTVESPSWGKANLLSADDSDFENGIGGWMAYDSNTTVSQDTVHSYLHNDSLQLTATAAGDVAAKSIGGQINVVGGDQYRISAWVKMPASNTGRTVTIAAPFNDASCKWIGWVSGSAQTLNATSKWQYVSTVITAPANAAYSYGTPRITENGVSAGETLNVDEVMFEPYRAATVIGAKDPSTDGSQWNYMNSTVGPSQVDKEFYSGSLPSSYSNSNCANLPSTITCVEAYKTPDTNVASFVSSIPAGRNTILVFHQEPENDTFSNGPDGCNTGTNAGNFVCEFEAQANLVRGATTSSNIENVFLADDSSGYNYGTGRTGADCSWTVPTAYTDMYFMDHYMNPVDGNNSETFGTAEQQSEFTNWIGCVGPQNKPLGFGEYGNNCKSGMNPDDSTVAQTFAADNTLLEGQSFTGTTNGANATTYNLPFVNWMYWWYNNTDNCQFQPGASPDGTGVTNQWQANETQNGGGAN